ncbi:hypothetical protein [Paenibacillus popilliae]|uniref:Acetyl-CoA carboxylase n=1 Tax=Paenibacillus popilliae ATCC 14706 TaxID=1212764 RepID=M9LQ07_PAEPP|nr:hypothetical protein [Paenibacillus popilliae]GAC42701.1 acetyl-CoA carboxylase [Paenibacillus popilliae ATCC 14706]
MKKEERWPMYFVIQEQKRLGLKEVASGKESEYIQEYGDQVLEHDGR